MPRAPSQLPGVLRSAVDDDMIDEPALQPAAPGPDVDLDAVLLHVGAGGQDQPALGHGAGRPALAAVVEPPPVRRLAGLDPGLAEDGVAEGADRLVRALGRLPRPGDPLPAQPARRRVERREVEADRRRVGRGRRRPPLAALEHRRLVVLGDRRRRSSRRRRPRSPACPSPSAAARTSATVDVRSAGRRRSSAAGRRPRTRARSGRARGSSASRPGTPCAGARRSATAPRRATPDRLPRRPRPDRRRPRRGRCSAPGSSAARPPSWRRS